MRKHMKIFCRHESLLEHVKDFHRDEINRYPRGVRSMWKCPDCGKYLFKNYLSDSEGVQMRFLTKQKIINEYEREANVLYKLLLHYTESLADCEMSVEAKSKFSDLSDYICKLSVQGFVCDSAKDGSERRS